MALQKGKFTEVPEDAVILTEKEAVAYQMRILKKWKYATDVWAVKYGTPVLASLTALAGIYINNYYRKRFQLRSYGKLASYLPICVVPAAISFALHSELVLPDVILQKDCPVCIETRAAAMQAFTGCVFPALLAPVSTFSLAIRYATYDIPYIFKEPKKVFNLWLKHTKPIGNNLFAIFIGQAFAATLVTYLEARAIRKCNERLMQLEYNLENVLNE